MSSTLTHIHIAPTHGAPLTELRSVQAITGKGLEGDRNLGRTRQVTIVARGELEAAAEALGRQIMPGSTRRNLTIDVDDVPRTHGTTIEIGSVTLTVWRDCAPCELMEEAVGPGARAALRLRAGVSAGVESGGLLSVGDPVKIRPA